MSVCRPGLNACLRVALHVTVLAASLHAIARANLDPLSLAPPDRATSVQMLATKLSVGDVVFIRVSAKPFREVATATESWTNHVGIVIDTAGEEPLIGESTFPVSRTTTLSRFISRSEEGRVAVARLKSKVSSDQQLKVAIAAHRRAGVFYDTGFNLHSRRQFCSRYVYEVLQEATGVSVGEVETFATLLSRRPDTDLRFWKVWYFGQIPWQRETITPAALLRSPAVQPVFDGVATNFAKQ